MIHSHLSFSQRSIRNSFHSLRPSSVGSEAARRKKQQSREWKQKHKKCYARRKQRKEEGLSLEADQTANHQVRFARRCAASHWSSRPAKPVSLFHGWDQLFGCSSMWSTDHGISVLDWHFLCSQAGSGHPKEQGGCLLSRAGSRSPSRRVRGRGGAEAGRALGRRQRGETGVASRTPR